MSYKDDKAPEVEEPILKVRITITSTKVKQLEKGKQDLIAEFPRIHFTAVGR